MYLSGMGAIDQIAAVWQAIRPEAINAHVGSDGWWYDDTDNHRLSHDEAALRQQQLVAGMIGATVNTSTGWWVDDTDNHQLSHEEAYTRYQSVQNGTPWPVASAPGTTPTGLPPSGPFAPPPPLVFPTPPPLIPTVPVVHPFSPLPPSNTPPASFPPVTLPGSVATGTGLFGLSPTMLALSAAGIAAVFFLGKKRSST